MPTYVYECSACKKTFEVEQRIVEDPLKDCQCGGIGTLKRLIQPIAVMFKGSGFHINDYSPSSAPPETAATAEKTEAKVETKAEAKTEAAPAETASKPTPDPS